MTVAQFQQNRQKHIVKRIKHKGKMLNLCDCIQILQKLQKNASQNQKKNRKKEKTKQKQ